MTFCGRWDRQIRGSIKHHACHPARLHLFHKLSGGPRSMHDNFCTEPGRHAASRCVTLKRKTRLLEAELEPDRAILGFRFAVGDEKDSRRIDSGIAEQSLLDGLRARRRQRLHLFVFHREAVF